MAVAVVVVVVSVRGRAAMSGGGAESLGKSEALVPSRRIKEEGRQAPNGGAGSREGRLPGECLRCLKRCL